MPRRVPAELLRRRRGPRHVRSGHHRIGHVRLVLAKKTRLLALKVFDDNGATTGSAGPSSTRRTPRRAITPRAAPTAPRASRSTRRSAGGSARRPMTRPMRSSTRGVVARTPRGCHLRRPQRSARLVRRMPGMACEAGLLELWRGCGRLCAG